MCPRGTKNGLACTFLEGTLTYTPTHCDRCHAGNEDYTIIKNGTKTSTIVIPAGGTKKTYLELRKQRFYCKQCQTTFVAKTSLVNEGCFISKDTCLQAGIKTAEARSIKDIARDCAVSPTTVQREINKTSQELQTYDRTLPENLSFDEFKVAKGQMAFIYIDVASGDLLDILPQRDGRTIRNHFTTYFTFKQRKKVKTVTIDMNASYQGVIKDLFPNAKIIIDRFHIVQLMTRAMNKTRVKIMQAFNTSNGEDKKKYRRLKRYWRLMLKPSEDLSSTEYKHYTMFGQLPSKSVVDTMLEYSDELKANHDLLQR
uniref:ISL3 family transposase n=1 Tax=Halolactibacillus sp. JCM 19043 TaxID=1460638 RepID=UPI000780E7E0